MSVPDVGELDEDTWETCVGAVAYGGTMSGVRITPLLFPLPLTGLPFPCCMTTSRKFGFLLYSLRRRNHSPKNTSAAKNPRPPIIPPAIAPVLLVLVVVASTEGEVEAELELEVEGQEVLHTKKSLD